MAQKPSIPKGTRDFTPEEMRKRNFIFDNLKSVFQLFGFQQIETPAMENLSTLLGKYGEEGDKLLFRILDSGDYFEPIKSSILKFSEFSNKKVNQKINGSSNRNTLNFTEFDNIKTRFIESVKKYYDSRVFFEGNSKLQIIINNYIDNNKNEISKLCNDISVNNRFNYFINNFYPKQYLKLLDSNNLIKDISEKGLRYDLTVPFARFVVQNRDSIQFPFKRYQIQPVWRADRPQKGRYREFYQCDVDIVGSDSLLNEVELIQIIDEGFKRLGVRTLIKINNRKILSGISEIIGEPEKIVDITVAIDKLDKIGLDNVIKELRERQISDDAIVKLQPLFELSGSNSEKLEKLRTWLATSEIGIKGVDELQTVFNYIGKLSVSTPVELDLTLARGLNYYTGAIFEVKALDVEIGSICGGGRYDNLTGIFGLPGVSGVGISFGADRIFDVLNQLNAYPESSMDSTQLLFVNFGEKEQIYCLPLIQKFRAQGIKTEIFPDSAKMKKQMGYADAKKIPFVAMIGEEEMNSNLLSLKNMQTGEQVKVSLEEAIALVKKL